MKLFNSVKNILQGLILHIFLIHNGFPEVLSSSESLVSKIPNTAEFLIFKIRKLRTVRVEQNLNVVLWPAVATFKRNAFAAFKTLKRIQIVLMGSWDVRFTIYFIIIV